MRVGNEAQLEKAETPPPSPTIMSVRRAILAFVSFRAIEFVASSFPDPRNSFPDARAPRPRPVARALACFEPHADLVGIGVRVATYLQSILFLFTTTYFVSDGLVVSRERKTLGKIYTNLLIVGYALVIAALAHTSQLGLYNALIILDLSWMLAANAILVCVMPVLDGQAEAKWHDLLRSFWPTRLRQMVAMFFVSAHLCVTGAFGLYVWFTPFHTRLTASSECARETITYVLFTPISVTNPRLRTASLVLSVLAAIPIINVALLTAAAVAAVNVVNTFICRPYTFRQLYFVTMLVLALVNVLFIANTEMTVRRNRHLVDGHTSGWSLGQILILALAISPILELGAASFGKIGDSVSGRWKARAGYTFRQVLLRENEVPFSSSSQRIQQEITDIISKLQPNNISGESDGLLLALRAAEALVDTANKRKDGSSGNDHHSMNILKRDVERVFEQLAEVCGHRFSDVKGHMPSVIVRAYLEAARDVISAANRTLDAMNLVSDSCRMVSPESLVSCDIVCLFAGRAIRDLGLLSPMNLFAPDASS